MLTRRLALNNKLCKNCTAKINLKKLNERERRNFFGTGLCPECYSDFYETPITLFDI